jgi:hypothetical protein
VLLTTFLQRQCRIPPPCCAITGKRLKFKGRVGEPFAHREYKREQYVYQYVIVPCLLESAALCSEPQISPAVHEVSEKKTLLRSLHYHEHCTVLMIYSRSQDIGIYDPSLLFEAREFFAKWNLTLNDEL